MTFTGEGEISLQNNRVVLGVIGADVHAVGNKILEMVLTEAGFEVINLGVMVSQEEFINAAVESDAGAIWVSSLYGHGEMDCRGLREKCYEAGIGDILLYAGGNLVVGKRTFDEVEQLFREMGYDRVYPPGTMPEEAITHLKEDLTR
jgi:methylaspartate mutase sigma subunit